MRHIAPLCSTYLERSSSFKTMFKKALTAAFVLPFIFIGTFDAGSSPAASNHQTPDNSTEISGILQKMIVESGTAVMALDLNRLNGIRSVAPAFHAWQFDVGGNSFFSILVFNDLLRGPEQGSMALVPAVGDNQLAQTDSTNLPPLLAASFRQLTIERRPSSEQFDLAVRDAKTGFTFFRVEGQ